MIYWQKNTNVIATEHIRFKLAIKEALYIKKLNSLINRQFEKFDNTLKLQPFKNEIKPPNKSLSKTMSNDISFNEEEFVTSTQNLNDSDAIDKCIHLMLKKARINV